jgi:transglutaminase superfamily protein
MINYLIWMLILFLATYSSIHASVDNDYKIHLRKEVITVNSIDSGYVSKVEYYGETGETGGKAMVYFNQLEEVDELKVGYFKKGGQLKNIRRLHKEDLSISKGFYSDTRIYLFDLPENKKFKYEFQRTGKELMLFAGVYFHVYDADTQIYIIRMPNEMNLRYEVMNKEMLVSFESSVSNEDGFIEYYFKGVNKTQKTSKKEKPDYLRIDSDPYPAIKVIITPKKYKGNEEDFFNDWFVKLVEKSEVVSPETEIFIKDNIGKNENSDTIIKLLFDMVTSKIRYIDIEIGIGSFRPHKLDYIIERKQGDCKDMANLICQSLRQYGIEANLAISATLGHRFNMDFPSLSCGNHMICVAKDKNNNYLFLDPTETQGHYLHPSRQIQGTSVFVFGVGKGFYLDVPIVESLNNKSAMNYYLKVEKDGITGTYSLEFNAISSFMIKTWYNEYSNNRFSTYMTSYLEILSPKIDYKDYVVEIEDDGIILTGEVEVPKSIYSEVGDMKYILMNFLPHPHSYKNEMQDSTGYITYTTINTEVNVFLDIGTEIASVSDISIYANDEILDFRMYADFEDSIIHFGYQYMYNDVIIEKPFTHRFIQFDNDIKDKFSKAVVVK